MIALAVPATLPLMEKSTFDESVQATPIVGHALLSGSRKPIDFGNDGTSASLSLAGRFLSLHIPHPVHGVIVIVPYEQFPFEKFYDPLFVRQYRARPLQLLSEPDAGFGLSVFIDGERAQSTQYEYIHSHAPRIASTVNDVEVDSLYVVLPSGDIVQTLQLRNTSNSKSRQVEISVDGLLSLNRASYAQLTEGGPIPMPPAGTSAHTTEEGFLVVENEHLPARLTVSLQKDDNIVNLSPVAPQDSTSTIVEYDSKHAFTLAPHSSTNLFLCLAVSTTPLSVGGKIRVRNSLNVPLAVSNYLSQRGDLDVAVLARAYALGTTNSTETRQTLAFATVRNVEYLLGLCSIPMGPKGVCVITDHQCLPLGWNRDNYYQLGLLRAVRPHLRQLVSAHSLPAWRSKIDTVLREHLIWVFTAAQRPKGYWGRSYLANGVSKDDIFQLDQQCYPLLELSEWAIDNHGDPASRALVEQLLRSGVVDEVLTAIWDHRWMPEQNQGDKNLMLFKTEETPGDDAVIYPYHFSSHVLLWRTLDRLSAMLQLFPQSSSKHDVTQWASGVHRDTLSTFVQTHPISGTSMFTYLASTKGEFEWYHDANDLPTALAPSWGFCSTPEALQAWSNTMAWAFSNDNDKGFFADGRFAGLGSVHTTFPWPLGDAQELIWAREMKDEQREARVQHKLAKIVQWDGLWSEAIDGDTGVVTSKHWFGWPGCFIGTVLLNGLA